jgi:hypothetical protein
MGSMSLIEEVRLYFERIQTSMFGKRDYGAWNRAIMS